MTTEQIATKVTEKLVSLIESGVNPWRKPWNGGGIDVAISHTTGRKYSLLNQILLGFRGGEYVTFKQVKAAGGSVKKGAKSQIVVFWCTGYDTHAQTEDEDGNKITETIRHQYERPILKYYNVFHIADTTLTAKFTPTVADSPKYEHNNYTLADSLAADYCEREGVILEIRESGRAYYRPAADSVTVPLATQFPNLAEYYSTLFHELTHSTGHKSRLDRFKEGETLAARRQEYSREELVAEIGAATVLSRLMIDDDDATANSAAYLKGWCSYLKDNPKEFIIAAGRAEKAVNLIFNE